MKNLVRIFLLVLGSVFVLSCVSRTYHVHHVPPGHAKKIMKSKSGRPYAPGQVKKMEKRKHPKHHKRHKH